MALDDKDLEIARLRGKVEALEQQLANVLAARGVGVTAPAECMHLSRDAYGRCLRCNQVVQPPLPPNFVWPSPPEPPNFGPFDPHWTTCKTVNLGGEVWTGTTTMFPPPRTPGMASS